MDRIAKGNRVIVPLLAINQSTALWGEDALEFRYAMHPIFLLLLI